MNKYEKLLNNSLLFFIGNFGSKFINLIMVPLYTNKLSTSEYGIVDLSIVTVNLLLPIITLEIGQAILRYSIKDTSTKNHAKIFSVFISFAALISLILIIVFPILSMFEVMSGFLGYFMVYFIFSIINIFYSQFTRGIGLVKAYAFSGILMTVVTVISNLIFLVVIDFGVEGYFISIIIAQIVTFFYFFATTKSLSLLRTFAFDFKIFKNMINYSYPLIPNGSMLWLISSATRYFILYYIGTAANGLFAVANKVPQLLGVFTTIFSQAWQLSSFEEFNSETASEFYSKIFSLYSTILFLGSSAILIVLKPAMSILIDESFFEAWTLIPILLYGIIYQSLNGFLGTIYTSIMRTKGVFTSSFIGMIVSIICNIVFIPLWGLQGAGIGTLLAYVIMTGIRYFDTQKYLVLNVNFIKFFMSNIIYIFQILLLFKFDSIFSIIIQVVMFIFILIVNIKDIFIFAEFGLGQINKKK